MARDRASIRVDMWGDGDFRRLSVYAQWLYMALLSHPTLSYAGVADWRPGRLAAFSSTAEAADVEDAAAELMRGRFILVDTDTEEVLVRSFVKHDGLLKQPKLTVSMCNAFAAVASPMLREVIAFEVQKLNLREPGLKAWEVVQMKTILAESASPIDAFTPGFTHRFTPDVTPGFTPNAAQGLGLPTSTATSTATPLQVMGGTGDESPPSPFCKKHEVEEGTDRPCRGCKLAAARYDAFMAETAPADEPYEHQHRWLTDGTCMTCEEVREVTDG